MTDSLANELQQYFDEQYKDMRSRLCKVYIYGVLIGILAGSGTTAIIMNAQI